MEQMVFIQRRIIWLRKSIMKGCDNKMTISEVSKKYNLTQDTIRYYEKIGLLPRIPRTKNGIRDFDDEACRWSW